MPQTPFLDLAELQEVARDVELPSGWSVRVYQDRYLGPHVRIVGRVPDSTVAGKLVDLGINSRIPPVRDPSQFMDWLESRWTEIWIHEARETLRYQGKLWSDPHAEPPGTS